jgi:predicted transcriptional regulator
MKKSTAVKKAKSAYKLAQLLGITRQAVSKWGDDVPPAQVERLRELRPTWFKRPVASNEDRSNLRAA